MEVLIIILFLFFILWPVIKLLLKLINWIFKVIINIINSFINTNPLSFYCKKCNTGYKFNIGCICPICGKNMKIISTKDRKKINKIKKKNSNTLKQNTKTNNEQNREQSKTNIIKNEKNKVFIENSITKKNTIKNDRIIKNTSIKDKSKEEIGRYLKSNNILYEIPNMLIYDYSDDSSTILLNLLCQKNSNYNLKFIILDTLKLTFLDFKNYSHLFCPINTDFDKANIILKNISTEIEKRSALLEEYNCKNIRDFNKLCIETSSLEEIPYLYIVINDLINFSRNKETSDIINNLVLKGKIVGINLIMFSKVEKKYLNFKIIDNYVEKFTIDEIIKKIETLFNDLSDINENNNKELEYTSLDFLHKDNKTDVYDNDLEIENEYEYDDPLYNDIVDFAIEFGKISASLIQRKYRISYNRAARIIDLLEERGIIGPQDGSKPREVLVNKTTNST